MVRPSILLGKPFSGLLQWSHVFSDMVRTCGNCLLAQAAAKARVGDKAIREWRGTAAEPPAPVLDAGADPDEVEEEEEA